MKAIKYATLAQLVLPNQANPAGNVHGGEIMKMMDSAAAAAAARHAHTLAVTARVDEMNFKHPVYVGDLVTCNAHVIYTGRSSMEVFVTVETENLQTGATYVAQTAFFTMVALNEYGIPSPVPPIEYPSDFYEQMLYAEGEKRHNDYNKRKKRDFSD